MYSLQVYTRTLVDSELDTALQDVLQSRLEIHQKHIFEPLPVRRGSFVLFPLSTCMTVCLMVMFLLPPLLEPKIGQP